MSVPVHVSPMTLIWRGVSLLIVSHLGRRSRRDSPTIGVWNEAPAWARRVFAVRRGHIMVDDALAV